MKRKYGPHYSRTLPLAFLIITAASLPLAAQAVTKLKVVASTPDLAAIASEVAGDRAEVESLALGRQDLHSVQGKPSYLLKMQHADLLLVVGLELEAGWLTGLHHTPSAISQSGNPRIQPGASGYFDASQYAEILENPTAKSDRNSHPLGNPHYWLDPENGRKIAVALANKLSDLRPIDASYFSDRLRAFDQRLSAAEKAWNVEMLPYRGRKVIVYRRSWSYFLKYFQLVSVGEIEPSPGIPPAQSHTTELINVMKRDSVKVILVEDYFDLKIPKAIAQATGAELAIMPSSVGEEREVNSYFRLFDHDLAVLIKALTRQSE